jgi:hypothetical protein
MCSYHGLTTNIPKLRVQLSYIGKVYTDHQGEWQATVTGVLSLAALGDATQNRTNHIGNCDEFYFTLKFEYRM